MFTGCYKKTISILKIILVSLEWTILHKWVIANRSDVKLSKIMVWNKVSAVEQRMFYYLAFLRPILVTL